MKDGVEVEEDRDRGFVLVSFRMFLDKGDIAKSACSREPARTGHKRSKEL